MKRYERPGDEPREVWQPVDPEALVGVEVELVIHTMETHEEQMKQLGLWPCSDPDCEFHHPEVREY